ncbi:hypothetical protein HMPREF1091_01007 [Atopobium minutum 10063974]|uniref:Uncharacterized protein n=2 Tax=Atopobium minutum TaxID=1381 RepID=N2BU16_9ACTN|nr:hypothetical protein HMPREF1091_01007 [Atopobium minutum 10063974]SEC23850.1 hypothetical protein SAMN04489746_1529 [Atopobium minutum]
MYAITKVSLMYMVAAIMLHTLNKTKNSVIIKAQ